MGVGRKATIMADITRWNPFGDLQALQKQFFGDDWNAPMRMATIPTTDVYTKDNTMVVEAHLPHFSAEDITIDVDKNRLTIEADRHEKEEDTDKKYVIRETSNSFYRQINLPEGADEDGITASLEGGVLSVSVPLAGPKSARKIEITSK